MYRPEEWQIGGGYATDIMQTIYEEGANAMLIHIIELTKKSAPNSKLLEVLECNAL